MKHISKIGLLLAAVLWTTQGVALAANEGGHGHGDEHKEKDHGHGDSDQDHAHKSPHGGIVKTVGENHVELVVDTKKGGLGLYILDGKDERKSFPLPATEMTVQLKFPGEDGFHRLTLKAVPQKGDPNGKSSFFQGFSSKIRAANQFRVYARVVIGDHKHRVVFDLKIDLKHGDDHQGHGDEDHTHGGGGGGHHH